MKAVTSCKTEQPQEWGKNIEKKRFLNFSNNLDRNGYHNYSLHKSDYHTKNT